MRLRWFEDVGVINVRRNIRDDDVVGVRVTVIISLTDRTGEDGRLWGLGTRSAGRLLRDGLVLALLGSGEGRRGRFGETCVIGVLLWT